MSQVLLARSSLAPNLLRLLITLLTGFALLSGAYAFTQSAGDRWVMLATRALDTKTGRASIDLRRAKGAFKAVRLTVKTGALTLTRVELTYGDGTVLKVRRSLTLREEQKSPLIGRRAHDAFIDNIALTFKGAAGELDRAVIEVAGLQSPQGQVAVRGSPPAQLPSGSTIPDNKTASQSQGGEATDRRRPDEETRKKAPREPGQEPKTEAEPPKPAPVVRGIAEPWDVVPVFYGTDRGRQQLGASTVYGTERARRLELGRALVTVPRRIRFPILSGLGCTGCPSPRSSCTASPRIRASISPSRTCAPLARRSFCNSSRSA